MRRLLCTLAMLFACEACVVELVARDVEDDASESSSSGDAPTGCIDENDCPLGACIHGECTSYVPRSCACATNGCDDDEVCDNVTNTCTHYCDEDYDCAYAHPLTCDDGRGICVEPCMVDADCTDVALQHCSPEGLCALGGAR